MATERTHLLWRFPARHCHEGLPLGNGTFGALLWSDTHANTLRMTINRADYWLHEGGWFWPEEATYANLRRWLAQGDEAAIRRVFEGREPGGPRADRPTRLPMGRVDIALPGGLAVHTGSLDLDRGEAYLGPASDEPGPISAVVARDSPLLAVRLRGEHGDALRLLGHPPDAPDVVAYLTTHGCPLAERFGDERRGGWLQARPNEPMLCVAWDVRPGIARGAHGDGTTDCFVVAVYGHDGDAAVSAARASLASATARGYAAVAADVAAWWRAWWTQAAVVTVPDETADLLYRLGLYKLGGLSVPGSPAASLQGPWVEEHRLPPWSSDYHFNVNVQECYWPAYGANHVETLDPLAKMLTGWEPTLRENARRYVGIDDGLLLPHAVDDRGTCMGGFWTGQTDHGSTAWTAQLFWQRYRHTLDRDYLRETAFPFLRGALRTYEAMLEPAGPNGAALSLPVGVSPEFGGSGAQAWGRDASFQLACIHMLCRALDEASATLGIEGEDQRRWRDVARRLPIASIGRTRRDVRGTELVASTVPIGERELFLWEGQPLPESHRHQSHLAAIHPFALLDPLGNAEDHVLAANSLRRVTLEGMGAWTGWCVPWAAILHARLGQGEMAGLLLEIFRRTFMGPGYATTHDAVFSGLTIFTANPGIMQIEAGLGAASAVLELLAQTAAPGGGALRVFSGTPRTWRDAAFSGVRTDGAFLLDAVREDGVVSEVRARSEAGGLLRLAHPFGERGAIVRTSRGVTRIAGASATHILAIETAPGDDVVVRPA